MPLLLYTLKRRLVEKRVTLLYVTKIDSYSLILFQLQSVTSALLNTPLTELSYPLIQLIPFSILADLRHHR